MYGVATFKVSDHRRFHFEPAIINLVENQVDNVNVGVCGILEGMFGGIRTPDTTVSQGGRSLLAGKVEVELVEFQAERSGAFEFFSCALHNQGPPATIFTIKMGMVHAQKIQQPDAEKQQERIRDGPVVNRRRWFRIGLGF